MFSRKFGGYFVLVATALFATAFQGTASAVTGTVALWHMDETSGTVMQDSSGNNNNGTLHNVTLGEPGVTGTAYGFNGTSSYVSVPDSATLDPGAASFSISANIKFSKLPAANKDYDVVRKGLAGTAGGDYKIEIWDKGQAFCRFKGTGGVAVTLRAGPNLGNGAWHSIMCSKSDSSIQLVIDGKVYSKSGTAGSINNSQAVEIGAKPGDDFFNGDIDEVKLNVG